MSFKSAKESLQQELEAIRKSGLWKEERDYLVLIFPDQMIIGRLVALLHPQDQFSINLFTRQCLVVH